MAVNDACEGDFAGAVVEKRLQSFIYLAKQVAVMAATQAATTLVVDEARELGFSETQIRCGLAVFEIIGMRNAFKGKQGCVKVADTVDDVAKGGTYLLRDAKTGEVMRVGRTNNLARRGAEHGRDVILKDFQFEPQHRTDNYGQQRGLEQMLHDKFNPPLDKINPIGPNNPNKKLYIDAANE